MFTYFCRRMRAASLFIFFCFLLLGAIPQAQAEGGNSAISVSQSQNFRLLAKEEICKFSLIHSQIEEHITLGGENASIFFNDIEDEDEDDSPGEEYTIPIVLFPSYLQRYFFSCYPSRVPDPVVFHYSDSSRYILHRNLRI